MQKQKELLKIVFDDLRYLESEWGSSIKDDELRRGSTVLRRLLVNGDLLRSWRISGISGHPYIVSPSLSGIVSFLNKQQIPIRHLLFALSGSAPYGFGRVETPFAIDLALSDNQIKELYEKGRSTEKQKLNKFINSPCIYVTGTPIVRRELIQFVSNKLGGAHYDEIRNRKKLIEEKFRKLDEVRSQYEVLDKNAIYYELLSIGYHTVNSDDVQLLISRLESLVG